jgi:dipeptidase E
MGGGQDVGDPVFAYVAGMVDRPRPKVCLVPTASSAVPVSVVRFLSVFPADRFEPTYLDLFARDDRDLRDFLLSQDLIFVGGGSTANGSKRRRGGWRGGAPRKQARRRLSVQAAAPRSTAG